MLCAFKKLLYFCSRKLSLRYYRMELTYITRSCRDLADEVYQQCAELYSQHYGKYSGEGSMPKGQRIRMSMAMYKRFYADKDDMYVSLCYEGDKLLGHAFFLKKNIEGKGVCSWVTQLVVHSSYRNNKIGSKLLQSAWGFSDFFAWGLATANAITLKTLEAVTWRKITVEYIENNLEILKEVMDSIPFADKNRILLSAKQSMVFTDFYPELEASNKKKSLKVYAQRLGKIKPGYEWLAFTFADQTMIYDEKHFTRLLDFSEQQLKEAYERMDMPAQPWTQGTENEINWVGNYITKEKGAEILDIGCGQGRHLIELARRGYANACGIDFSRKNITKAMSLCHAQEEAPQFICADARQLNLGRKFDVVLCLYDVIGSFRNEKDNMKILRNVKRHLRRGGRAVVSVMNMELTESIATNCVSLKESPTALLHLPPSDTMARSGNVFKPNLFLINKDDGLVYRKEQFYEDGMLSAEYLVVDKRYTMDEFEELAQKVGLKTVEKRYVQAGHWDKALNAADPGAKELLFVFTL